MATKQATSESATAENTNGLTGTNGNGEPASPKHELTKAQRIRKANQLMEEAWDMIYEDHQKALKNQKSDV